MKTSNKILLGGFLFLLLSLFSFLLAARMNITELSPEDIITGKGQTTRTERSISDFQRIEVKDDFDIYLSQGPPSLTIEANDNIKEYIETIVKDNELKIRTVSGKRIKSTNPIILHVSTNELTGMLLSGKSSLFSDSTFQADVIEIQSSGTANIRMNLQANFVNAHVNGVGRIHLTGTTEVLHAQINGAARFSGGAFEAKEVNVNASGASRIFVNATEHLKVSSSGSSEIRYKGDPQVRQSTSGVSSVRQVHPNTEEH